MRIKTSDVLKGIVMAVGVAGILAIAIAAPNLPSAFGQFYKPNKKYKPSQFKRSLVYGRQAGFISIGQEGDKTTVSLTDKGKRKLLKYKLDDMKLQKAKKWDHKWRLVLFDIPEKFKLNRDVFSFKLKQIGFVPIQKSVFVWPYDCRDEVDFLRSVYEVERFVRLAIVDEIEREHDLRRHFGIV